jgi:glycosyltransferase involved in cell wall biosynthesis
MRIGLVTVAYNEERMIKPFLSHIPKWVDEVLVLVSAKPWFGEYELPDRTDEIAREMGATVIVHDWSSEEEQRNAGQEYFGDMDWIIVLDPDEYLDNANWEGLRLSLPIYDQAGVRAIIVEGQYTYWKTGYVADPPRDYPMLIGVKPEVRFIDKRVVDSPYTQSAVWLHHMSWAKTNKEVWSKISHYAHANDFDIKKWYEEVWLKWKDGMDDVHPVTPQTLHKLIPATLPKELERLKLWPPDKKQ